MRASILSIACLALTSFAASAEPVSFRQDIAPILQNNCLACHGPKKAEGGYRVDSFQRVMAAGDSGEVGFSSEADASESFRRIVTDDPDERMPWDSEPLRADEIALVKRWIEEGAKYDADDPAAPLSAIVPPPVHPSAPEVYGNTLPITAVAFSPDGEQLIVGGYNELTLWSPQSGQLLKRVGNVGQRTYALAYSPDGKLLAVGSGAPGQLGEVRLLDAATGELQHVLMSTSDVVFDLAFNPAGDRLAVASADGVIRVFGREDKALQLAITSHSDWVMAIAWSADGSKLASASRDKTSKVFDAKTGDLLVTYSGHAQPVKGVAFHPDGAEVFSSGGDKKVHQWKVADGKKTADVTSFGQESYKVTTGGAFMFVTSADKSARQFELKTRKQIRQYSGHQDYVLAAGYHDATKRLATGAFDGEVRVWNTEDGKPIVTFVAAPGLEKE